PRYWSVAMVWFLKAASARSPKTSRFNRARRQRPARRVILSCELLERRELLSGTGFLQGTAFLDSNQNNQLDPNEMHLAGATIQLYKQQTGGAFAATGQTVTTGADGAYLFTGLDGGTYRLVETPPAGYGNLGTQILSQLY